MKPGKFWCTAEEGIASGVSSRFQQRGPYCETCVGRVSSQHAGEVDEDTRELGYGAEGVCSKGTKASPVFSNQRGGTWVFGETNQISLASRLRIITAKLCISVASPVC